VNHDARFLGRINRVVLFGIVLGEDRLSNVDVAIEVVAKVTDRERLAARNRRRVEPVLREGHVLRIIIDGHFHRYREACRILKGGSRFISLLDYAAEKSLASRFRTACCLVEMNAPEELIPEPRARPSRRPCDCLF
jgi:hypothetical protein